MYGVGSTRRRTGASGTPAWVPEDALAHLDFVEGQYYASGATWSVASLLSGGFDAGDIDANGMACWYTNTNRPNAAGAFFDVLESGFANGMSIVAEIDSPTGEATNSPLLIFLDDMDANAAAWATNIEHPARPEASAYMVDFDDLLLNNTFASRTETGINRYAYTLNRDMGGGSWRYAVSANGETAVTQDLTYDAATRLATAGLVRVAVGAVDEFSWAFDQSYIRSITVYAAVDEAALAVLSEIPTA